MKCNSRGASGLHKMPKTDVTLLLDDRLIIFIRSWNGNEINQKIIDEIHHYISSIEADIELTNSFEFVEHLSSLANKIRVSILLANDAIYRSENKEFYQNGAEILVIYKNKTELVWASIGRFKIETIKNNQPMLSSTVIYDSGTRLDNSVLLPVSLLGLIKNPEIQIGSVSVKNLKQIQISSIFMENETYWISQITDFED